MYCNLNKAIPVIEEMISRPGGATIKEIKDILKIKRTKVMLRILRNRMDLDLLAMFKMTAEEIKDDHAFENGRKRKPRQKSRGPVLHYGLGRIYSSRRPPQAAEPSDELPQFS